MCESNQLRNALSRTTVDKPVHISYKEVRPLFFSASTDPSLLRLGVRGFNAQV